MAVRKFNPNPKFKPDIGERYYFPSYEHLNGVGSYIWTDKFMDNNIKRIVGLFQTREQATKEALNLGFIQSIEK